MAKTLDERLRAMEGLQEIMNLKARYLNGCDGGWNRASHDADAVASTFAEDGWWQAEGFPRLSGREAIRNAKAAISQSCAMPAPTRASRKVPASTTGR